MVGLFEGYKVGNRLCLRCELGLLRLDTYGVVVGEMVEENEGGLVQLGDSCRCGGLRRNGWVVFVTYFEGGCWR